MGETQSQTPHGPEPAEAPQDTASNARRSAAWGTAPLSDVGRVDAPRRLSFILLLVAAIGAFWFSHVRQGHDERFDRWRSDALLSGDDRLPGGRYYLILRQLDAPSTHAQDSSETTTRSRSTLSSSSDAIQEGRLRAASLTIEREAPDLRVPVAAPPGEIGAWLDAHALYLLPLDTHAKLAARFEDDAMTRSVQELRARLSSPLFGLMGEDARRDPLEIRPLLEPYLRANERPYPSRARPTSTGDLISADGRALLVELRFDGRVHELRERLTSLLQDELELGAEASSPSPPAAPLTMDIVDPGSCPDAPTPFAPFVAIVACALVAFAVERRVRLPLLRLVASVLACALALAVTPEQAPFSAPFFTLLLGSCFWLTSARAGSSFGPAILGLALLPLLALVYPGWWAWASAWSLACTLALSCGIGLRRWLPEPTPTLSLTSSPSTASGLTSAGEPAAPTGSWTRATSTDGRVGSAMSAFAALLLIAAIAGGSYAMTLANFEGVDTLGDEVRRDAMADEFFDPVMIARTRSSGANQADALARAAEDHAALRQLADELELRLEGPGAYLLARARLEARRDALRDMRIRARMQVLRSLLETQGFRPDAFSEFLDTSARLNELPDAQAALDGNLGPWIDSLTFTGAATDSVAHAGDEAPVSIESSLHFSEPAMPTPVADSHGEPLRLFGPPIAAARDATKARTRLLLLAAISAWLASLLSFIARRHLASSLLVGAVGLASMLAATSALVFEGVALSAELLIPILLVMAACQAEAEAGIEAVSQGRRSSGRDLAARMGPLLALAVLCLISPEPTTHRWGLIVAVGLALGGFAAHVLSARIAAALTPDAPRPGSPQPRAPQHDLAQQGEQR